MRLDSLAVEERVGFIKLDIEGYELAALRGARRTIQRDRPAIVSEFSSHFARQLGYPPCDMLSELEGYAIYVIGRRGKLQRAKKFDRDGAVSIPFLPRVHGSTGAVLQ